MASFSFAWIRCIMWSHTRAEEYIILDFYGEISCLRTPPFKFMTPRSTTSPQHSNRVFSWPHRRASPSTNPASLGWDAVRRAWAVNGGTAGAVHTDHYRLEETWRGVAWLGLTGETGFLLPCSLLAWWPTKTPRIMTWIGKKKQSTSSQHARLCHLKGTTGTRGDGLEQQHEVKHRSAIIRRQKRSCGM